MRHISGNEEEAECRGFTTPGRMNLGKPPVFNGIENTWKTFKIQLEEYLEVQDITDEMKRRAILISSLPDAAVRVIQGRCHPSNWIFARLLCARSQ